ncbi:MAG: methylthioribulose 1-phosphate dehydratase [Acidobacteriaceae bacterium]|nr:methylthioribulose 1-phosphate dehydratase [Acidobacteriaceae bacterium]
MHSYDFRSAATALAEAGRSFYERGWVLGTAGNFSAVLSREPLQLAITTSGLHKGELGAEDFLIVDESGNVLKGAGKPSAETLLHVAIAQSARAGAVLHTHSVWATLLSDLHAASGGFAIEGYEMLKGLAGVVTHEHTEWLPILENTQNYSLLAAEIASIIVSSPRIHGFLMRRHGLYTWGKDIFEARRHVEILEFLFEVVARQRLAAGG